MRDSDTGLPARVAIIMSTVVALSIIIGAHAMYSLVLFTINGGF